jgi:hypothetical protein
VRGVDRERNFEPEPVPQRSLDAAALQAHATIMARHTELLMGSSGARLK